MFYSEFGVGQRNVAAEIVRFQAVLFTVTLKFLSLRVLSNFALPVLVLLSHVFSHSFMILLLLLFVLLDLDSVTDL